MSARICLITSAHVASNPRLVKEADALAEAGFAVRVMPAELSGLTPSPREWIHRTSQLA